MSDEEIMRRDLREQYAEISDKAFEKLYKQQVADKFKLDADEWGEEDSELGRELLKIEADRRRQKFIEWQKNFTAPATDEVDTAALEAAEAFRKFEESVKSSESTKTILEQKRISIKTTDGDFNYEVADPNSLVDMTVDNSKFFNLFSDGKGGLDYNKWYKAAAYSLNQEQFERSLINYGKSLGRDELSKEIKNPSAAVVPDVPTETGGDFTTGLLNAFASRGVHK